MDYKTISLVLTDEKFDLVTFNAAAALAERNNGHLEVYCLGYEPIRYDMVPIASAPVVTSTTTGEARKRAEHLVTWAEEKLRGVSFGSTVQPLVITMEGLEAVIARTLRFSDLIVAAQPYGGGATRLHVSVLESVLFGTEAPVLVVPQDEHDYAQGLDRALIMWNESTEALDAVRKSMPFLQKGDRTEIVIVDPPAHSPERSDPGGAICLMLARHGIKSEVSILSKTMPQVAEVVNRHATDRSINLIVMGAYGHSRFREALIGGATRDMLESANLPILMAH